MKFNPSKKITKSATVVFEGNSIVCSKSDAKEIAKMNNRIDSVKIKGKTLVFPYDFTDICEKEGKIQVWDGTQLLHEK